MFMGKHKYVTLVFINNLIVHNSGGLATLHLLNKTQNLTLFADFSTNYGITQKQLNRFFITDSNATGIQ